MCIVSMVPAWVVAFLPEIFTETLAPSSDFAVSIGFCSYLLCRGDKCGSQTVEPLEIRYDTERTYSTARNQNQECCAYSTAVRSSQFAPRDGSFL